MEALLGGSTYNRAVGSVGGVVGVDLRHDFRGAWKGLIDRRGVLLYDGRSSRNGLILSGVFAGLGDCLPWGVSSAANRGLEVYLQQGTRSCT